MAQTGDGQRVDTLTTLLTAITGRRYGLPQQNHPSDVLAEAYIDVLERRLHRANARVWRYSDDFRIATDSWSDALATVDLLEREVRRIGLTLNDSKTVIRRGDTYEASLKRRYDAGSGGVVRQGHAKYVLPAPACSAGSWRLQVPIAGAFAVGWCHER